MAYLSHTGYTVAISSSSYDESVASTDVLCEAPSCLWAALSCCRPPDRIRRHILDAAKVLARWLPHDRQVRQERFIRARHGVGEDHVGVPRDTRGQNEKTVYILVRVAVLR